MTDRNTPQFHQLSGWLVSDDPAGEEARCGGPGLVWSAVVSPVWRTAETAYDTELKISVGQSYGQHAYCMSPQFETSVALCCVTKLHILERSFIIPSTRCISVMNMLFNQLIDMPHLSGGCIILTKDIMLINRNVNTFVHKMWEKLDFCAYGKFQWICIPAHETWHQHVTNKVVLVTYTYLTDVIVGVAKCLCS
jgi:hypothetical protein